MEVVKRGRGRPCTKPCRFFRIILPSIHPKNWLRIPEKFARRYSYSLSKTATLSIPTGHDWKVKIRRSESHVYFTQGWEEFLKHNSIRNGYFLEFEYKGNFHFRVQIFDLSCCEIEYSPLSITNCSKKEEPSAQVKKEEEATSPAEMLETKYEIPFFTLVFRKSNFSGNYLYVPGSFAKKYLTKKSVKLQGLDGREWKVRCHCSKDKRLVRMNGNGLKIFMQENKFCVGEKFIFQLMGEKHDCIMLKFFKA